MGSLADSSKHGFSVIIVGAGIAGLAAAIGLSRKGHRVTVLESKPALNEFGASIGVSPSAVKVLNAWGLDELFAPIVTANRVMEFRNGATNMRMGWITQNLKDYSSISYGAEFWNVHRADYQQVLAKAALEHGTQLVFSADVKIVDMQENVIILNDGRRFEGDLIVGADGMRSAVRHSIPALSNIEPVAIMEQCYRCSVPKSTMRDHPTLNSLLTSGDEVAWLGDHKYILTWPLPDNKDFDVVACIIKESDVPAGLWGIKGDPAVVRKEFQEFCPEVHDLLARIDGCMKWTLAELPPVETCRNENGNVVLIGDAFHAKLPHAGSGGASAIEDAAVLGECVDWAYQNKQAISKATEAFEMLRKPRVRRIQIASHQGYGFLTAGGEAGKMREKMLGENTKIQEAELALSREEKIAKAASIKADMDAPFPTPPFLQWLYSYDAISAAQKFCSEIKLE